MVNNNKIFGSNWERKIAAVLNDLLGVDTFKRVPGSGALGTILGEASLKGDVKGSVDWLPKTFLLEAKTGYNSSKSGKTQLTVKKDWFDKIQEEADTKNAVPLLACKFKGARSGVKHFIAMDVLVFAELMNEGNKMLEELNTLYEKIEGKGRKLGDN